MIVADANLLVYRSLNTNFSQWALAWEQRDPLWIVPEIWRFEFNSAMVQEVRTGRIEPADAEMIFSRALETYSKNERRVDQIAVLRAAIRYRISPYDANYIVLAEELGTYCVTADNLLLERVPRFTRRLSDLS